MTSKRLPIDGNPHLYLASQDDVVVREKMLTELRSVGFKVEPNRLVPPKEAHSQQVIAAITTAFNRARQQGK